MNGPAPTAVHIGSRSRVAPLCEAWDAALSILDRGFGPVVDLAIRLWLAQIFFVSGVLKCIGLDLIGQSSDLGVRLRPSDRSAQQATATGWLC